MSLFDRFRECADRLTGKAPRPVEPPIDSQISSAWANASSPSKPSLFDRFKEGARNRFKTSNANVENAEKSAERTAKTIRKFQKANEALDEESRKNKTRADSLRADRNRLSKQIGGLMAKGEREEAEKVKAREAEVRKGRAQIQPKQGTTPQSR